MEGIKMVSGQTPGPMQQGPYQMYQPVYQMPQKSTAETLKTMFLSDMMLAIFFGIGLLLMWVGSLIYGTANDHDGQDLGMIAKSFGMLVLTGAMILAGLVRHDMEKLVRLGLILSATLLLIFVGFWAGVWL
jgi:hypothetical protein